MADYGEHYDYKKRGFSRRGWKISPSYHTSAGGGDVAKCSTTWSTKATALVKCTARGEGYIGALVSEVLNPEPPADAIMSLGADAPAALGTVRRTGPATDTPPVKANFEPASGDSSGAARPALEEALGGVEPESDALAQPPAATAEAPRVPVGAEISKVFDGVAYRGQVVSFDPEHKLYAVEYDDGDAEELTEEVRATFEKRKTQHQIYYFNMILSNFFEMQVTG